MKLRNRTFGTLRLQVARDSSQNWYVTFLILRLPVLLLISFAFSAIAGVIKVKVYLYSVSKYLNKVVNCGMELRHLTFIHESQVGP